MDVVIAVELFLIICALVWFTDRWRIIEEDIRKALKDRDAEREGRPPYKLYR
jgi:hypothetical protein